jgi:YfiH family protein
MHREHHLQSGLLARAGFVHAFFTRQGGISEGPFASLNLSTEVGDRPEHVQVNLGRAAAMLNVPGHRICVPRQVHGREVEVWDAGTDATMAMTLAADACISSEPELACAVRTADCVPILLADPLCGRVAAVHAGWRGVVLGVVSAAVAKMAALGSDPARLVAAIGPHISAAAFEVGDDVAEQLESASVARDAIVRSAGQKPHADLAAIVRSQLALAGCAFDQIERVPGCTHTERERFFSYRRDGARSGRSVSAIVPRTRAPERGAS